MAMNNNDAVMVQKLSNLNKGDLFTRGIGTTVWKKLFNESFAELIKVGRNKGERRVLCEGVQNGHKVRIYINTSEYVSKVAE